MKTSLLRMFIKVYVKQLYSKMFGWIEKVKEVSFSSHSI